MAHFEEHYLARLPSRTAHLEIGPGHGLLLNFAAATPAIESLTGWDVSATSIEQTKACLAAMGESRPVDLVLQDMFDAPEKPRAFGSVVMAEVLEHLEDPVAALRAVARHMRPNGHMWINVPINSPAPDHLYLLRTPEEAVDLVRAGGFEPVDCAFYPMTGQSLERARKLQLTISAAIAARLPA
jgi:2-polyprenyl-3-methyl-5-hydroxy-6-metoxy-1,4-benzoquinol methylase